VPQQKSDFAAVMAANSDVELAEVLTHPDDYVPEALEAARVELLKRNTTVESLAKQREEAIQTEISYDNARNASLKKRAVLLGASVAALAGMIAAVMEFLQPARSLAHFTQTLMGIGISITGVGLVLFFFHWKFLARIARASASLSTPRSSLEGLRQNQSRSEAIRSTFLLSVSILCGGIVVFLIGVLTQSLNE
jgi:hypothetical protein